MIFRAELSQNRQFRIIFENQASNPVRNSRKLPHGNAKKDFQPQSVARKHEKENFSPRASRGSMKKRILVLERRAEAWNFDFNFYMTIMLTGLQYLKINNPKLLNKKNYSDAGVNHRFSRKITQIRGTIDKKRQKEAFVRGTMNGKRKKEAFYHGGKSKFSEKRLSQYWEE